ncbi:MAG TPA: ATP-binding protein [Thermoanaerobaculia bacterium]|nr:ATP-binding protein [Thermoanaerobaculia bacterium]
MAVSTAPPHRSSRHLDASRRPSLEPTLGGVPPGRLQPAHSLRRRFLIAIVALVGLVLVGLSAVLVLTSRSALRRDIEQRGESYAALATGPICEAYDTYYWSGYSKFRELLTDVLGRNPDIAAVAIYDTAGKLLFGSSELGRELYQPGKAPPAFTRDARLLAAARGLRTVTWVEKRLRHDDIYRVVVPYVEEWGRHRYSAVYDVSYRSLNAALGALGARLLWLTAGSLLLGSGIAYLLARQILRPLSQLTARAGDFAEGRLDRRLDLRTGDELEVLARTFNHMASRLAVSITDLEASNRALQQSNVELRELDRLKSDLLANVSHELRTPLTSLKGYAEAFAEELLGPLTEAQREALEVCSRNLNRLLYMINELLSYARFESGGVQLERRPLDLAALARQVVDSTFAARGPDLNLHLDVTENLPAVEADGQRISQVLDNLLTNAVKFTPAGGRIDVRLWRDGDEVVAEVADTGIGIPRSEQQRIFERFYQVESTTTRKYGGIGLGLAIVRQILDAHGSTIELVSEPGMGSTFRFRLPVAAHLQTTDGRGPRVVVVDDDVPFSRGLADHLEAAGYQVRIAGSFQSAEQLVRERRPRMVILDRLLPDGDGFDLIVRWREALDEKQLPILVVSVRHEEALARRLGASACLTKPVEPAAVQAELERLLAGIRAPTVLLLPLGGGGALFERLAERLAKEGLRLERLAAAADLQAAVDKRLAAAVVVSVGADVPAGAAADVRLVLAGSHLPTGLVALDGADLDSWRRELRVVGVATGVDDVAAVASLLREAVSWKASAP